MAKLITKEDGRKICKTTAELIEEFKEKGVSPCKVCKQVSDPTKCGAPNCYAWNLWFCEKWEGIRKVARRKGYNV